jgi:acetyl esterase/lipase
VRSIVDLEYRAVEDANLFLDIHRPDCEREVPCVAYFHGGGWARGSRKEQVDERLLPFAAHGLAVASVSYRLVDMATHPAQLEDARAAVAWLRERGAEYGLRTERIGAWGASAGGWIALMLNLGDGGADAAAAWFPVTELATVSSQRDAAGLPLPPFMAGREPTDLEAGLLGVSRITEAIDAARAASPVTHVTSANGPTLLIHGDADGFVNAAQSLVLHERLLAVGKDSQLMLLAGANHEDPAFEKPAVLAATAGFFSAVL